MTKPVIVTRLGKGSELTFEEGDANFTNLRDATISVSGDSGTTQIIELNGTIGLSGGTGLSTNASAGTITVNLDNTTVSPGSYTKANITVDDQGRITAASNGSISSLEVTTALGFTPYNATNPSGYISGINSTDVTTALGFTPESTSNKNQANGYAGLDVNGKVASAQLPSYVDDVEEYASQASFPATGESGKIYVDSGSNKVYRWSGSVYVEISPSPGSTDSVTEGTTNLYFTTARARDSFSAGTNISITDGVIAVSGSLGASQLSDLNDVSIASPDDNHVLVYNTTTSDWENTQLNLDLLSGVTITTPSAGQVLTYTMSGGWENQTINLPPTVDSLNDLSDVSYSEAGIQAGQILKWNVGAGYARFENYDNNLSGLSDVQDMMSPSDGQVLTYDSANSYWKPQSLPAAGISSVSADTAPSLGGNLTVAGYSIVSTSNGNIAITPNGTGKVVASRINYSEAIHSLGTTSGTITPNVANGNVQTITLNGNLTFSAFSNPVAGQSLTLIINTNGTGRTLTSTMKFTGGSKTLSTTSTTDIISVFYDGTNYWASLATDFK